VPAAVAVQNARILADAQRVAVNLQRLLTTRAVIDQAIGVLINRSGISAEQAFNRLRTISHTERIKVHTVATRIVDDAIRRAGARRKDD
jgi:AmiR/NasT family two-component response regulator